MRRSEERSMYMLNIPERVVEIEVTVGESVCNGVLGYKMVDL